MDINKNCIKILTKNGFSLAEMMVVLLIITIIITAIISIMTKQHKISDFDETDGLWSLSPTISNDIYSRQNNNSVAVLGSDSRYGDKSDDGNLTRGKFRINASLKSESQYPQFGFMLGKKSTGNMFFGPESQIYLGSEGKDPFNFFYGDHADGVAHYNYNTNLDSKVIRIGGSDLGLTRKNLSWYKWRYYGAKSINIGYYQETDGNFEYAIPQEAVAIGSGGQNSSFASAGGIAIGSTNTTNQNSVNIASKWEAFSTSIGAIGNSSIAIGSSSLVYENSGIAIGSQSFGDDSYAIGPRTFAFGQKAIAIGYDAMIKDDSTYVGAGKGQIAIGKSSRITTHEDNNGNEIAFGNGASAQYKNSVAIGSNSSSEKGYITLGNAAYTVNIPGSLSVNRVSSSDIRLKNIKSENIDGLDKIKQLSVFNYNFKNDKAKKMHVGVIAQDLQKVFPQAISKDSKGFLLIRTEDIFYAMVNSIKELDTKISKINSNIKSIMLKNNSNEKEIDILSKKFAVLDKQIYEIK